MKADVTFVCEKCGRSFTSKMGLTVHSRQHDANFVEKMKLVRNKKQDCECDICSRHFDNLRSLAHHKSSHDQKYIERQSIAHKKFWKDNSFAKVEHSKRIRSALSSDEVKDKMSSSAKRVWEDSSYREQQSITHHSFWDSASDDFKTHHRKATSHGMRSNGGISKMKSKRDLGFAEGNSPEAYLFVKDYDFAFFFMSYLMYEKTVSEVANRLGISYKTVMGVLNRFDLKKCVSFSSNNSMLENDIRAFMSEFCDDLRKDRRTLDGKELDIYSESKRLAVEVDGAFWHNDYHVDKNMHLEKTMACQEKGVRLIHVFEWEWYEKQDIVKSMIKSAFGCNDRIYARKCNVVEVDSKAEKSFLNENHIQGYIPSSFRLGLEYDNELVALMSFGKPRFNKHFEYELLRYATKKDISVVGGESRLFKHLLKASDAKSVLSYCNRSKFTGRSYDRLGFKHLYDSSPSYQWCRGGEHLSRYKTQMKDEDKIMRSRGYAKVNDCGTSVWGWKLES